MSRQSCQQIRPNINGNILMKKLMGFFSVAALCLVVAGCGEPAASTAPGEAPAAPPTGATTGDRESGVAGHGADAAAAPAEGEKAAEGAAPAAPAAEGAAPAAEGAAPAAPAAEGAAPAADAPKAE